MVISLNVVFLLLPFHRKRFSYIFTTVDVKPVWNLYFYHGNILNITVISTFTLYTRVADPGWSGSDLGFGRTRNCQGLSGRTEKSIFAASLRTNGFIVCSRVSLYFLTLYFGPGSHLKKKPDPNPTRKKTGSDSQLIKSHSLIFIAKFKFSIYCFFPIPDDCKKSARPENPGILSILGLFQMLATPASGARTFAGQFGGKVT